MSQKFQLTHGGMIEREIQLFFLSENFYLFELTLLLIYINYILMV